MNVMMGTLRKVPGLFVDDWHFAVAIAVWLAASATVLPWADLNEGWGGPVMFAGLAALLLGEVRRSARGTARTPKPGVGR